MTYNPWSDAAGHPNLLVASLRLPDGHSWWLPADDAIVLDDRLGQAGRRSALAHELIHRERGDEHCEDRTLDARRERRVTTEAARRLVTLDALADALLWSLQEDELADELWIDVETAQARLASLSPGEKDYIEARLDAQNWGNTA